MFKSMESLLGIPIWLAFGWLVLVGLKEAVARYLDREVRRERASLELAKIRVEYDKLKKEADASGVPLLKTARMPEARNTRKSSERFWVLFILSVAHFTTGLAALAIYLGNTKLPRWTDVLVTLVAGTLFFLISIWVAASLQEKWGDASTSTMIAIVSSIVLFIIYALSISILVSLNLIDF